MRINTHIYLKESTLKKDNRRYFLSLIKKALSKSSPELYEKLYNSGKPQMKKMSFALKFCKPKFEGNNILLENNEITMTISSSDPVFCIEIYNAMLAMKNLEFPIADNNAMTVMSVKIENTKSIEKEKISIYMLSPLIVREHNKDQKDRYYTFEDEKFSETFFNITKNMFKKLFEIDINKDDIKITPIKAKTTVTNVLGTNARCSLGSFELSGNRKLLNILYEIGLCSKRSQGFGLFDIL